MEASSGAETTSRSEKVKPEVKPDPEPRTAVATPAAAPPALNVRVKDEDPDVGKIDRTLPAAGGDEDIFEDVDAEEEPEYVDLTYEGIAHVNGVRHFVCEGFKIRQIPEPYIVKRKLWDLHRCIEAGSIILDPEYQREVVWDEGRAALLITSILMGFFIPPIIFNVKRSVVKKEGRKEEKYTRICVDGKQRLTSIYKFMNGQIGFFDTGSPQRKWFWCHQIIDGQVQISNRNILPKAVKDFFESQFFCCYEYDELDLDTEETMFQLVQRGVALTPAEKMRAMSTAWAVFTKQYEDDYSLIVNLSKQNRASGFRLILTIFTMIQEVMAGRRRRAAVGTTPTLQASPQALQRVLDDKAPINPALKLRFKSIFDRYEALIKLSSDQITATRFKVTANSVFDPAPDYLREEGTNHVRTFSPLELVVTAILVAVHKDKRTDKELLEDVKEMRKYLRVHHKDLRVNAQCWATSWTFITEEMDRRLGRSQAEVDADEAIPSIEKSSSRGRARKAKPGKSSRRSPSPAGSSSSLSSAISSPSQEPSSRSSSPVPPTRRRKPVKVPVKKRVVKGAASKVAKGRVAAVKAGKIAKVAPKKGKASAKKGKKSKA